MYDDDPDARERGCSGARRGPGPPALGGESGLGRERFDRAFLSNVFVDPETLPSALKAFVDVNPISILADASRGLMAGDAAASDVLIVLAVAAGLTRCSRRSRHGSTGDRRARMDPPISEIALLQAEADHRDEQRTDSGA